MFNLIVNQGSYCYTSTLEVVFRILIYITVTVCVIWGTKTYINYAKFNKGIGSSLTTNSISNVMEDVIDKLKQVQHRINNANYYDNFNFEKDKIIIQEQIVILEALINIKMRNSN